MYEVMLHIYMYTKLMYNYIQYVNIKVHSMYKVSTEATMWGSLRVTPITVQHQKLITLALCRIKQA